MKFIRSGRRFLALSLAAALLGGAGGALLGVCGPFTDVAADAFCTFVLEIFYLGITTGTTPTTYDPAANVTRLQMAAFLSRTVDGTLKRGGRRAALRQFWTTQGGASLGLTTVSGNPIGYVESDGVDLWVSGATGLVHRVHQGGGRILETWTGAVDGAGVLPAIGRIFVAGDASPGKLYRIDPSLPAGAVTTVTSNLGDSPAWVAFDGGRIWTTNLADQSPGSGSISIVTPGATIPWTATTVSLGFNLAAGILYDGSNIWVADILAGTLLKLDPAGAIVQTVTVGTKPVVPVFDGANIWVPNFESSSVSVVRASSGAILATLTGNGLSGPYASAFDGQRVLITNNTGQSVSLFKAADLTAIGSFGIGRTSAGACSDGVNFWLVVTNGLVRF